MARRASLAPVLEPRLSALIDALPAALTGEPVAVHQARVASRRLREVVPVATSLDPGEQRRARRTLRRLTRTLGRLREADVSAQLFDGLMAAHPLPPLASSAVRRTLAAQRAEARRELQRTWTRRRLARLDRVLDTLRTSGDGPYRAAALAAATRLDVRARRSQHAVGQLGVLYAPDRLHAVRIAVKRWRYSLELAADVGRRRPARLLVQLRAVQDQLGRAHDLHVLASLLRDVESRVVTRSRAAARALRQLSRVLDDECRTLHAAFLLRAPLSGAGRPRGVGAPPGRGRDAA